MTLPVRPARPTLVPNKSTGSVFSRLDFPQPRDFEGDGIDERRLDTSKATIARQRRLQHRLVEDGERTYHAYSADELIEIDSLAHHGRPGMPY